MAVKIDKFRTIVNKHAKLSGDPLKEKLNVVDSDSGSYAYLSECIADSDPNNFQGLKESDEGSFITPGDNTYTIDYNSALISFAESYVIPSTLYAYYWGGGSVIWADDVTSLQEACNTIHANALYKDGSVALTGNLDANGNRINNVASVNGVSIQNHAHLGTEVDGTVQLGDDSISSISISKVNGLNDALNSKQNNLPTYQSGKYLTNNGSSLSWGNASSRNIGELVQSVLPLNDPKLQLLTGTVLSGSTTYKELYNYMLNNSTVTQYNSGVDIVGSLQNSNHVISGFTNSDYAQIPVTFGPVDQAWEIQIKFKYKQTTASVQYNYVYQNLLTPEVDDSAFISHLYLTTMKPGGHNTLRTYLNLDLKYTNPSGSVVSETLQSNDLNNFLIDNNDYWLKIEYSNTQLNVKLSSDGETYTNIINRNNLGSSTFRIYDKSFLILGANPRASSISPWLGSIDLKECYLSVGNNIIWQGGTTYYRADSSFILDEGIWQSIKYKYGLCGKFVVDTINQTVRVPRIYGILQGTLTNSATGNIVEAGLPNITGNGWVQYGINGSDWAGAFKASNITGKADQASGTAVGQGTLAFNASWSNPIYGNSNTVQPQTTKVLYYIVVSK